MATKEKDNGKQPAASGAAPAPRQRQALSMEKRLAIQLALVLAAVKTVTDTKDGKAAFQAAKVDASVFNNAAALADEVNQKTIKPIENRLKELEKEVAEASKPERLMAAGSKDGDGKETPSGAQKLKTLIQEFTRLQARKANLQQQATGA
jgi:hypothetical protein